MARVFWDTNLFIYLFEENPEWSPRVNNAMLEKSYLNFFGSDAIKLAAFNLEAAQKYADIRSKGRIRPADAIQLACAAAARTDLFVTNDNRLSGLVVTGVTFVTGIDRIPY